MIKIKNGFLKNENEIRLVKFIGRYQYLSSKDVKYFFNDTAYYQKRITRLIKNNVLRRYNKYLVLGENGYNFLEMLNENTGRLKYNKNYVERLKFISHIAAVYNNNQYITFYPSFEIKDKTAYTETSRKYIGTINTFGIKYLMYHISSEHSYKYISSIIYDIQKETKYKNIIILINDINRVKISDFSFGLNSVIFLKDDDEGLENLKYLQLINWNKVIFNLYGNRVYLSEYNFCDYTDNKNKYISTFDFIDAEKINRINTFLINNSNKKIEIVSNENIKEILR